MTWRATKFKAQIKIEEKEKQGLSEYRKLSLDKGNKNYTYLVYGGVKGIL